MEAFDTVINGAGPAGLLAACLLHDSYQSKGEKKNLVVFEMRQKPTNFYGSFPVVLNKRGRTAISHLGEDFLKKVQDAGLVMDKMTIAPNNRVVASFETSGLCIMRDTLVGLLLGEIDKRGIEIRYQRKLKKIDFETREVTYKDLRSSEDSSETVKAHRIIGADGNWSKTRRLCAAALNDFSFETTDWGIQMRFMNCHPSPEATAKLDSKSHYVLGADGYVCQQPNKEWSFSLGCPLPKDVTPENAFLNATEATEENIAKLKAFCQKAGKLFANALLNDQSYKSFFECKAFGGAITKCNRLNPTSWIALIGDAGHSVFPATGEGINSSFESAALWTECYTKSSPLSNDSNDDDNACILYDEQRRKDVHALNEIANWNKMKISGGAREKVASTIATIMLGIGKKMHIIEGTYQDYMLGKLSEGSDVKPYSELVALEKQQTKSIMPLANFLAKIFVREETK